MYMIANDKLIGANGQEFTGKLFRQVSPILGFLYDNVDSHGNTVRQNSYFSVPIWAEQEDYKEQCCKSWGNNLTQLEQISNLNASVRPEKLNVQ